MTTLICWFGRDSRKITSVYLASDSRISWGANKTWESGRKLYYSKNSMDIIGFCGDVLFPSQVLPTVMERLDLGTLCCKTSNASERHEAIIE